MYVIYITFKSSIFNRFWAVCIFVYLNSLLVFVSCIFQVIFLLSLNFQIYWHTVALIFFSVF